MSLDRRPRIAIEANGPYRVRGSAALVGGRIVGSDEGPSMAWELDDEPLPTGRVYALCRCGGSSTKPFCDDSHLENGFDGTETADRGPTAARRRVFEGGLTLTDDRSLCSSAGFCTRFRTDVWHMVMDSRASKNGRVVETVVSRCPSGRLELLRGGQPIEPAFVPSIVVVEDGPYWVRGRIHIQAADGAEWEVRNRVALCRCGQSSNKPFCDGTHQDIGFRG
jgi:CDGSH-type Zn-finger protein